MKKNQKIKLYLFIMFLFLAVVFAISFPRLTMPFGFAYIIYLLARPLTVLLTIGSKKKRIGYFFLILLGFSLSLLPLLATLYNLDADFVQLAGQLPDIQKILQDKFFSFKVWIFEHIGIRINIDPVTVFMSRIETEGTRLLTRFPNMLAVVFEWFLLVPLFLYFFFMESNRLYRVLMETIPNPIFEKTYVLSTQFNTKFGEYIIAKFIEATILGTLVTIGLIIIGFPYPFILGFIAGVTNILPYIGPLIGLLPAIAVGLLSKDPNASVLSVIVVFGIANLIDMILIFPLLVSKIVNLHPILVVVSIIVGSQLGGVVGMIVIIPFIAFFKLLFKEIYKDLSFHA
jgi:putative permease